MGRSLALPRAFANTLATGQNQIFNYQKQRRLVYVIVAISDRYVIWCSFSSHNLFNQMRAF